MEIAKHIKHVFLRYPQFVMQAQGGAGTLYAGYPGSSSSYFPKKAKIVEVSPRDGL